jgi:hypothetical protein
LAYDAPMVIIGRRLALAGLLGTTAGIRAAPAAELSADHILGQGKPQTVFGPADAVYDNTPQGTVVGTVHASNDLGGFIFSQVGTTNDHFSVGTKTGHIVVARSLAGRANTTEMLTVRARSGTSFADISVSVPIGAGTTLPPSNMVANFSTSLDNSMSHGSVGTVTVRGIGKPTFLIDVADDECQLLTAYPDGRATPRYTIKPVPQAGSRDSAAAVVAFSYISAQTDRLVITAVAGPVRCTRIFPLEVAAKPGPTKTIGPAGTTTAYDFPSVNAAMDAAWTDPAKYAGAVFLMADRDYSNDFNRHQIGHGSEQQFWPCPVTLRGINPNKLTVIDMKGRTSGVGKGLIMQNRWDLTVENLEIRHVSNADWTDRPNAAAFYKEGQTAGNIIVRGCYVHDCDNGILGGDCGTHWVVSDTVIAMCGAADWGYCHNAYFGAASSVTATNLLSFATAVVHAFKSRAYRTTIRDSALLDGENGGASSMLDTPNGGVVHVSGSIFQKGPNPEHDPNIIQYGAEGIDKPVSSALYEGNIFINTLRHGNSFGDAVGIANSGSVNPFDGTTNSVVFRNNVFYNFKPRLWTTAAHHNSQPAIDGGGNASAMTWPVDLDPGTVVKLSAPVVAALRAHPPGPGFTNSAKPDYSLMRVLLRPLSLQLRLAANAPPGTIIDTATGYGRDGAALQNQTYRLIDSAKGKFAIDAATGALRVAGRLTDGLEYIQVGVSGTGLDGTQKTIALISWFFIVVGQASVRRQPG